MSRLAASIVALWLLAVSACNTPTVPIPPPDSNDVEFSLDTDLDTATFSYLEPTEAYAGAVVYVFNRDKGMGIIDTARADGTVGPTDAFPAQAGDDIVISFQVDDELQSICLELADGRSGPQFRCSL